MCRIPLQSRGLPTRPLTESCSVDSCWRNILFLIAPPQVSFFFPLLPVSPSQPLSVSAPLCPCLPLRLPRLLLLISFVLSHSPLTVSSSPERLPPACLTFPSRFTLLTISSSTLAVCCPPWGLLNLQNWGSGRWQTLTLIFQLFL